MQDPPKEFFRYLPVSEREEQWGLYVRAGGFESLGPGEPFPRPGHPHGFAVDSWSKGRTLRDYAALYVTRGEGELRSKPSGVKRVVAGNVFLLFPNVWHYYGPSPATGWDNYWVVFNGHNVDRLLKYGFISPEDPVLNTGLDDLLLRGYVTLIDRLRAEPVGFERLLAASVMEILGVTLAAVRAQGTDRQVHELICRAKSLLETQLAAIPAIETLAASLGLSPTHFYRVFKNHTGLSPYQYYLQLRMERAKQMLHGSTMSVKKIAVTLAFESPFHFSRAFKRKTGVSPSQWRRQGHPVEEKAAP